MSTKPLHLLDQYSEGDELEKGDLVAVLTVREHQIVKVELGLVSFFTGRHAIVRLSGFKPAGSASQEGVLFAADTRTVQVSRERVRLVARGHELDQSALPDIDSPFPNTSV